jgi:hypothetical protein
MLNENNAEHGLRFAAAGRLSVRDGTRKDRAQARLPVPRSHHAAEDEIVPDSISRKI